MTIKGMDGMEHSVASNDKANTGVTLGAIGTGLGLLGSMGVLGWGGNTTTMNRNNNYVTKDELNFVQQLQAKDTEIASKDSALALKESENYTDKKLVEVYAELGRQINNTNAKIDSNYREQVAINSQQMAYNATANAQIDVLKSQVAGLSSVTKVFIPSSNVCQTGCGCSCNS